MGSSCATAAMEIHCATRQDGRLELFCPLRGSILRHDGSESYKYLSQRFQLFGRFTEFFLLQKRYARGLGALHCFRPLDWIVRTL